MNDDDECRPRIAAEIGEEELEIMIRIVMHTGFRPDIGDRALAWLDQRLAVYKAAMGQRKLQCPRRGQRPLKRLDMLRRALVETTTAASVTRFIVGCPRIPRAAFRQR